MTESSADAPGWCVPPAALCLPADAVHLWAALITCGDTVLNALEGLLSPEEQARIKRYRFPADRDRGILGRGMLRVLLARYLDTTPASLEFTANAQGKPQVAGVHAKAGLHFNIAHSGDRVLVAFARGVPIGVDVEAADRRVEVEKLARRFFAPEEAETLLALPPAERPAAFLRCWTRKEAYIKAQGMGLSIPLDSFTVDFGPGDACALRWVRDLPAAAAKWTLHNLDLGPGYAAALALPARNRPLHCWTLDAHAAWLTDGL